jgi:hypothetical protein
VAQSREGARRRRTKNPERLVDRLSLDFAALSDVQAARAESNASPIARTTARGRNRAMVGGGTARRAAATAVERRIASAGADVPAAENPALMRLRALEQRDAGPARAAGAGPAGMPVDLALPNWTPLGPLAVPDGQTYGGARVLISGRVTAIAPHPTDGDTIYIGTSRGGVWRTTDKGQTWTPLGDDQPSLAIGALAIGGNDPQVLYAGTGEGNVQFYSTSYPLSSAPGMYLGAGILRSTNGGTTWTNTASQLFANHSFYRIAVDRTDANRAFAASSAGLCRTTNGVTWTALTGGGLPPIDSTTIACTDVLVDGSDTTGNTVYAAFWGQGIYRSTNALAASPTFTKLTAGLPTNVSRISLAQSKTSPAHRYALIADSGDSFKGVYRTTTAAGTTWSLVTSSTTVSVFGAFTSDITVDPSTPDVVYVSGVELYKLVRNTVTGSWSATNVGGDIHPDSHAVAIHPTLHQTIYSGNDGGFFVSTDGGATWDDTPNEGLCLMQYESIDNHPVSDAVLQCGTQDNGTQQYRNSPVHYHSADGDGGYAVISKVNGNNMTHSYYGNSPELSNQAGEFTSWMDVATGLNGNGLFYPPAAISPTTERMAWATNVINLDDAMGAGGWPGSGVNLPGINGAVSAVTFANPSLIYCATTSGQVYRLDLSGATWTARTIHAAPLPVGTWIWDIATLPGNDNVVVVAFSGFGLSQHVWKGTVPSTGAATWVGLSAGLPDVPMYALALASTTDWYVGTDIGVFRTTTGGASWTNYSQGLPNTAVYDLRLRTGGNLLRAATHGRGLWEIRTDMASQPAVDLFLRAHIMDTGRAPGGAAATAAWPDPLRYVTSNSPCFWWESADIKTDVPPFQLAPGEVNYLNFETRLQHKNPERGHQNKVYVQVHNRGPLAATDVTVKIMVAGASAGLPNLPADFWATWPNSAGDTRWSPVGAPQTIPTLEPLRPTVLEWDWTPSASADAHTCLLVVIDSPSDSIAAVSKVFDIAQLITNEKHVRLKNLHVVSLLPKIFIPIRLWLYAPEQRRSRYLLRLPSFDHPDLQMSMLLTKGMSRRLGKTPVKGLTSATFSAAEVERLRRRWLEDEARPEESWNELVKTYDMTRQYRVNRRVGEVDVPLSLRAGGAEQILLLARGVGAPHAEEPGRFTVQQLTTRGELVGGSTFVFVPAQG